MPKLIFFLLVSTLAFAQGNLLVLNKSAASMAIVDPTSLSVIATVPTGEGPHEVAVSSDGRRAYVANYGTGPNPGNTISVIDLAARKELKRIALGGLTRPHGILEHGGKIYFTAEGAYAAARLDPASEQIDWITGTGQAVTHMIVVTRDGRKVYTANIGGDTVSVILLQPPAPTPGQPSQPRVRQVSTGKGPEGLDLSPDGRELWIGNRAEGTLAIIDTATDQVKQTLEVGKMPIRVKFTPDGKRVLVSNAMGNEVAVVDAATRQVTKRIAVGAVPVGIQMQPDGRRAFVAATQADKVFVIDLDKLEVSGTITPGKEPDGMAWAQ